MEIISIIRSWSFLVIELGLLLLCALKLRNRGGSLLAAGFGLLLLSSLSWRLVVHLELYEQYENIYTILDYTGLLLYCGFAAFFVSGILFIARLLETVGVSAVQLAPTVHARPEPELRKEQVLGRSEYENGNLTSDSNEVPTEVTPVTGAIGLYVGILYIGLVAEIGGFLSQSDAESNTSVGMFIFAAIVIIIASIYGWVLLYRMWRFTIQSSHRHGLIPSIDTPGKAIGYGFIPFYNFYWIFKTIGALPKELNAIARAKGRPISMSVGLGIAVAVLTVISVIPYLGYVTAGINGFILIPIFMSQAFNMCNGLSVEIAE
jgi:hypothetical protein